MVDVTSQLITTGSNLEVLTESQFEPHIVVLILEHDHGLMFVFVIQFGHSGERVIQQTHVQYEFQQFGEGGSGFAGRRNPRDNKVRNPFHVSTVMITLFFTTST